MKQVKNKCLFYSTFNFFTCNFKQSDYKNGIFQKKKNNNKIKFQITY